jgi:hypothetical protein
MDTILFHKKTIVHFHSYTRYKVLHMGTKQGLYSGPAMLFSHLVRLPSMAFLPKTGEVGYSSHDV